PFRLLFISPNKSRNEAKRNDGKISKNRKLVDGLPRNAGFQPASRRQDARVPRDFAVLLKDGEKICVLINITISEIFLSSIKIIFYCGKFCGRYKQYRNFRFYRAGFTVLRELRKVLGVRSKLAVGVCSPWYRFFEREKPQTPCRLRKYITTFFLMI
ncbi:MAG: hypothetical protein FWC43_10525, partial [Planctomycetaceae bacterium]|nr:hypothetical protein [Planctomycetaceae bacterium]